MHTSLGGLLFLAMSCCEQAAKLARAIGREVVARVQGERLGAEARLARLQVCEGCPKRSGLWCNECGCYLPAKARFVSEECPLGLWEKFREKPPPEL